MDEGTITVRCACGWEATGPEDAVVEATVEHGRRLHNMVPTRDEVIAMTVAMLDPIRFTGTIRRWNPDKAGGLAVIDIPVDHVPALGGLKQQRVRGTLRGVDFTSNVMPAGSGRLALSVSKAMLSDAHLTVGEEAEVEITAVGRD